MVFLGATRGKEGGGGCSVARGNRVAALVSLLAEEKWFGEKNSNQPGGGGCLQRDRVRFRVWFFFFLYFSDVLKLPSSLCVLKATIYRQNVAWASKLVPQLLLFVNFDFSYFFCIF